MRESNDMSWHGRIPLIRWIGETVLPIGFFAAGSPADLFECPDSHALIQWTLNQVCVPLFRLARIDLEVYA